MNLNQIIEKIENLRTIPKKRIKKDILNLNPILLNKIVKITLSKDKDSLSIQFNTKPHNIIVYIPKYYPLKPIIIKVRIVPFKTNQLISKIMLKKLPLDLVSFNNNVNGYIWNFINNSTIVDSRIFIYKVIKQNEINKLLEYDNIYNDWDVRMKLELTLNKYLECIKPYIYLN